MVGAAVAEATGETALTILQLLLQPILLQWVVADLVRRMVAILFIQQLLQLAEEALEQVLFQVLEILDMPVDLEVVQTRSDQVELEILPLHHHLKVIQVDLEARVAEEFAEAAAEPAERELMQTLAELAEVQQEMEQLALLRIQL